MMWFIQKNKKAILSLAAGLLLGCFMAGCKESAPPAQPAVVKKRIEQPAEAPKATPVAEKTEPVGEGAAMTDASEKIPSESDAEMTTASAPMPSEAEEKVGPPQGEGNPPDAPDVSEAPLEAVASDNPPEGTESLISSLLDNSMPKYDPTGKVDPFAALFSEETEAEDSDSGEPKRPLTPLEKIDISQLKLVAVLLAESGNRAMVEDATGKPYILTPGIYVGINSGVVKNILKDRVVIEEKTKDFRGRESASTRELKLQKPFGEE